MSDENKADESLDAHPTGQEQMTDRLASLRASIRASKQRKSEETEAPPPVSDDFDAAETQSLSTDELGATAPTINALDGPADEVEEPEPDEIEEDEEEDEEEEEAEAEDEEEDEEEAEDEEEEEDEPPPRPMRKSGEAFITGDLHRVRASEEAVLSETEAASLSDQMDQASEAAEISEPGHHDPAAYDVDPTIIQNLADLRFVQGTPLYMSPEQCRNDAAGPPTDTYSLGVMMFELLEGSPPYMAETVEEVIFKHLDAPVPAQRSQFTPPDVRDLVARMLSKDASQRPDTAEIIEVLQGHVTLGGPDVHGLEEESWSVVEIDEDEHVAAHVGAEGTHETSKPAAKRPPFWILGVLGAVIVCVVLFAWMSGGDDSVPPDEVVVAPDYPTKPEPVAAIDPEEPIPDEPPIEPPIEPELAAAPDAGATADAGAGAADAGTPDAGLAEDLVIEEPPKPKKKKKRRKRRRRTKKKKDELRELRLDL